MINSLKTQKVQKFKNLLKISILGHVFTRIEWT